MSKSEKRNFKLHSSAFKKESYLVRLYGIVEREKDYENEKKVVAEFRSVCKGKDFHGTKKKLYEQLLRSLRIYHSGISFEGLIKRYIESSQLLWQRRLFQESAVEISKAIHYATNFEFFLLLLQAIEAKTRIDIRIFFPKEEIFKTESSKVEVVKQYENHTQYQALEALFGSIHRKYSIVRSKQVESEYSEIMNDPLIKNIGAAKSLKAKIIRSNLLGIYRFAKCDFESSYQYANEVIGYIESKPGFEKMLQRKYVSSLGNALVSLLYLRRYGEMTIHLNKLLQIEPVDNDIAIRIFELKTIQIKSLLNMGDFVKALAKMPSLEKEMKNYYGKVSVRSQSTVLFYSALGNFGLNKYSLTIKYLNELLFLPGIEKQDDIHYFAKILNLIAHFEKSNMDHIEYKVKAIYKYFYARKNSHRFEALILQLIKEAIYVNDPKELISLFSEYKNKLEKILKDPFEKIGIEYFDVVSWLESKIKNLPLAEVMREKIKIPNSE